MVTKAQVMPNSIIPHYTDKKRSPKYQKQVPECIWSVKSWSKHFSLLRTSQTMPGSDLHCSGRAGGRRGGPAELNMLHVMTFTKIRQKTEAAYLTLTACLTAISVLWLHLGIELNLMRNTD